MSGRGRGSIAVVGAGLKAPGGCTIGELWDFLGAGRSSAAVVADERFPSGTRVLACRVARFDPAAYLSPVEVRRYDRSHHLAIGAAQDAMDQVNGPLPPPERCAVVCGAGFGGTATYESQHERLLSQGVRGLSPLAIPTVMPSAAAALLSLRFGFQGPCHTVSTACASGATAIGEGVELLRRGAADLVLAGGVDAMVTYNALCSYLRLDVMSRNVDEPDLASRPFDVDRDGFVLGEGAGFVVLERLGDARAGDRQVLGTIEGYASGADAHHLVAPSPEGAGALRCLRAALDDAGVLPAEISHVNAHGTATVLNDLAEARALAALFAGTAADGPTPPVTAVKGSTGHLIGGSGAVEAIVTLWSLRERLVPPVAGLRTLDPALAIDAVIGDCRPIGPGYGLTTSFGFGGANACLVLAA